MPYDTLKHNENPFETWAAEALAGAWWPRASPGHLNTKDFQRWLKSSHLWVRPGVSHSFGYSLDLIRVPFFLMFSCSCSVSNFSKLLRTKKTEGMRGRVARKGCWEGARGRAWRKGPAEGTPRRGAGKGRVEGGGEEARGRVGGAPRRSKTSGKFIY